MSWRISWKEKYGNVQLLYRPATEDYPIKIYYRCSNDIQPVSMPRNYDSQYKKPIKLMHFVLFLQQTVYNDSISEIDHFFYEIYSTELSYKTKLLIRTKKQIQQKHKEETYASNIKKELSRLPMVLRYIQENSQIENNLNQLIHNDKLL